MDPAADEVRIYLIYNGGNASAEIDHFKAKLMQYKPRDVQIQEGTGPETEPVDYTCPAFPNISASRLALKEGQDAHILLD